MLPAEHVSASRGERRGRRRSGRPCSGRERELGLEEAVGRAPVGRPRRTRVVVARRTAHVGRADRDHERVVARRETARRSARRRAVVAGRRDDDDAGEPELLDRLSSGSSRKCSTCAECSEKFATRMLYFALFSRIQSAAAITSLVCQPCRPSRRARPAWRPAPHRHSPPPCPRRCPPRTCRARDRRRPSSARERDDVDLGEDPAGEIGAVTRGCPSRRSRSSAAAGTATPSLPRPHSSGQTSVTSTPAAER